MQNTAKADQDPLTLLSPPVRDWFREHFPAGPTSAQRAAWPAVAAGLHTLLISPTGTGKTLAAFVAVLDRLWRLHAKAELTPTIHCVYVSPLRSLGYDVDRNLKVPLEGIAQRLGLAECPIRIGVRTGDTPPQLRQKQRRQPPQILITTPESLSLLLSQPAWSAHWEHVERIVVDEVHALAPTKRGVDLAVTLERLAERSRIDPPRIGLSATCRPAEPVARFLVGPTRDCRILESPAPGGRRLQIDVESLVEPGEPPDRRLTYRRLVRRLRRAIASHRTTLIFANTRPLTEKLTHDLRQSAAADDQPGATQSGGNLDPPIAAHHSALDAARRREIESRLKRGELRAVVCSTSLELGIDVGTADLAVQVGLPGGVARCIQRMGRSGHRLGGTPRGLMLCATAAELAGAVVTARWAVAGRLEPIRMIENPLDVVCQQLLALACSGEQSAEDAYQLLRRAGPLATLDRRDFDSCLDFLAGDLPAPPGAWEAEPGAEPRWTSPRIWKSRGWFGVRDRRVARWFWSNVGTITSEESVRVLVDGVALGTVEGSYAERLRPGDRFTLDGRCLEFRNCRGGLVTARPATGQPALPIWHSDRQTLTDELAHEVAAFRREAARQLSHAGSEACRRWLCDHFPLDGRAVELLLELLEAQEQTSSVPGVDELLVEEFPSIEAPGLTYAFHAPLNRAACEAMGRAAAARLGRRFGRDLELQAADLGWSLRLPEDATLTAADLPSLMDLDRFEDDVLEGIDRGELPAQRFRHIAATALMVLRNPEHRRRVRVGGLLWVSSRLYPLVKAACPDHPLLRETRREVLCDLLDLPSAQRWLASGPSFRFRRLPAISPFAAAWILPAPEQPLAIESPAEALRRLHQRLAAADTGRGGSS